MSTTPRTRSRSQSQSHARAALPSRAEIGLKKRPSIVALESVMTDLLELTGRPQKSPRPPLLATPSMPPKQRAQTLPTATATNVPQAPYTKNRSNSAPQSHASSEITQKAGKAATAAAAAGSLRIVTDSSAFQQGCYQPVKVLPPSSKSAFQALLRRSKTAPTLFASLFAPSGAIAAGEARPSLSSARRPSFSSESTDDSEDPRGAASYLPKSAAPVVGGWIRCIAVLELPVDKSPTTTPTNHHPALHLFPQIPSAHPSSAATTQYLPPRPDDLPAASFALISPPVNVGRPAAATADDSLILWNPAAQPVALRPPPQGDGLDPLECDYAFPLVLTGEMFRVVRERGYGMVVKSTSDEDRGKGKRRPPPVVPVRRSSLLRSPTETVTLEPQTMEAKVEPQPDYMAQFAVAAAMAADATFATLLAQKQLRRSQHLALRIPDDDQLGVAAPPHPASPTGVPASLAEKTKTAGKATPRPAMRPSRGAHVRRAVRHAVSFDSAVVEAGSTVAGSTRSQPRAAPVATSSSSPSSSFSFSDDDNDDTVPISAAELARSKRRAHSPPSPPQEHPPSTHSPSSHDNIFAAISAGRPSKPCEPVHFDAPHGGGKKKLSKFWTGSGGGRVAPTVAEQVKLNLEREERERRRERDAALIRSLTLPTVM